MYLHLSTFDHTMVVPWFALVLAVAASQAAPSARQATTQPSEKDVVFTIVYDNNAEQQGLTPEWGFGCVIRGAETTILFDTGGNGRVLLENMRQLNIDAKEIDVVVLSHIHGDHTGGLPAFLKEKTGVPVYIPSGFPAAFKQRVQSLGAKVIEADESAQICPGVKTTGTLGKRAIEEHGLCVRTSEGWVLVTGCAHPGVENMAAKAKEVTGGPIHLVVGGFHLLPQPASKINAVIDRFQELGVQRAAPCHCSGDLARQLFKQRLGERCDLVGVGHVFRFKAPETSDTP